MLNLKSFYKHSIFPSRIRTARLSKARHRQIIKTAVDAREKKRPSRKILKQRGPQSKVDRKMLLCMFKEGATLESMGESFGVTRERVRQVLAKMGVDPCTGGRAIRRLLNVSVEKSNKEKAYNSHERTVFKTWGIGLERYNEIVSKYGASTVHTSPFYVYMSKKRNAKRESVAWEMNFSEWWKIWLDSGKWNERNHKYVMGRIGCCGSYSKDNVEIISQSELSKNTRFKENAEKVLHSRKKKRTV